MVGGSWQASAKETEREHHEAAARATHHPELQPARNEPEEPGANGGAGKPHDASIPGAAAPEGGGGGNEEREEGGGGSSSVGGAESGGGGGGGGEFGLEEMAVGEELGATKPWVGTLKKFKDSGFDGMSPPDSALAKPSGTLNLDHVFGYRGHSFQDGKCKLGYTCLGAVASAAGTMGIIQQMQDGSDQDAKDRSQTHFREHNSEVSCLTMDGSRQVSQRARGREEERWEVGGGREGGRRGESGGGARGRERQGGKEREREREREKREHGAFLTSMRRGSSWRRVTSRATSTFGRRKIVASWPSSPPRGESLGNVGMWRR